MGLKPHIEFHIHHIHTPYLDHPLDLRAREIGRAARELRHIHVGPQAGLPAEPRGVHLEDARAAHLVGEPHLHMHL